MSESWTREELEATAADYFHMLTMEPAGQQYSKTDHRRKLIRLLKKRSDGTIERKHQDISAILIELGCPYISGYTPFRRLRGKSRRCGTQFEAAPARAIPQQDFPWTGSIPSSAPTYQFG